MHSKQQFTAQFAHLLGLDPAVIRRTWWANLREQGGLRLTDIGYQALSQDLELESYRFQVTAQLLTAHNLLLLDKKITCPYHISRRRVAADIVLFGGDQAIMATLYGDIPRWLQSLEQTQS